MSVRVSRMKLGAALAAACAVALVIVPAGMAALAKPVPGTPCNSSAVDQLPAFSWAAASGAAQYEFQIASDPNFTSFPNNNQGDDIITKNTRATLTRTFSNGSYYWRVRGLGASGGIGAWSNTCQFQMNWIDSPQQVSPTDGQSLVYPTPLLFNWNASIGARSYRLQVSSSSDMSNPVIDVNPTNATQYSPPSRLPSGTYYWTVQPIDAEGNFGTTSPVHSFSWTWAAGSTVLAVTDIDPSGDVYDPQFSWTAIQGAARYQLQVASATTNSADPWGAPAYDNNGIVSTTYTLTNPLPTDTYYWRVRAIDSAGNSGPWVQYLTNNTNDPYYPNGTFSVAYATGGVANLRVIDAQGNDVAGVNPTVSTPMLAWDPTAGASAYKVGVGQWNGTSCVYTTWSVTTANDAWTPLSSSWGGTQIGSLGPALDGQPLTPGATYCARVAPVQAGMITGAWTYLNGIQQPAFTFSDYPTGVPCSASCNANVTIGAANYASPLILGSSTLPVLTWNPVDGANGYVVVIATNSTFQTVVDEAYTRLPVYAPRNLFAGASRSYSYAVVPNLSSDGGNNTPEATTADPQPLTLPSSAPALVAPIDGTTATSEPTFQWQPVYGADGYNVAISSDPTFPSSGATQTYFTRATSYTPTSLPNATTLYWRVQGSFQGKGMSFSSTRSFQFVPTVPNFTGITNPASADGIPVLQWNPVPGAVSYDVMMSTPGNGSINPSGMDTTAYTPTNLNGTGNFTWKVRAEFPTGSGNIFSAWSAVQSFTRAIGAPQNATATVGGSHSVVASWDPKANARQYQVEFGSNSSFTAVNDQFTTDNTTVAPLLTNDLYVQGGTIYWRVQSQDNDGNWSAWSPVKTLTMPMLLSVTISGGATKGATSTLKVTVKTGFYPGKAVSGVTIKKSGCGLTASSAKTGSAGSVSFKVKPPKGNCNITFAASKTGAIAAKATAHIY